MVGATSNYSGISEEPAATTDLPTLNRLTASIQLSWVTTKARILLDFAHVRYLSSSMLGQLARLARDVESARRQLKITGLGPVLRDTFRIGHFEPLFAIYDDKASALKAFR
jgi:anti-anti-sigma factor